MPEATEEILKYYKHSAKTKIPERLTARRIFHKTKKTSVKLRT